MMSMPGITNEESTRCRALMAVAEKAGLQECSARLESTIIGYQDALDAKRAARVELDEAQADYDDEQGRARLVISRQVTKDNTKTYIPDDGERRQVSAPEAAAWVERVVAQDGDVIAAAKPLAAAKLRLEETEDRIKVAERRVSAAKYATDAAVSLTNLLATAFQERRA